jgi:hypothetical protein
MRVMWKPWLEGASAIRSLWGLCPCSCRSPLTANRRRCRSSRPPISAGIHRENSPRFRGRCTGESRAGLCPGNSIPVFRFDAIAAYYLLSLSPRHILKFFMALHQKAIAIGMTGPFGSGCTTAASILSERMGFVPRRLSTQLPELWEPEKHGRAATRSDLQDLGDRLRKANHGGILAEKSLDDG